MAKLYFKYGAMGSAKTAQVLITKFNYEERGMDVWLIKPSADDRDGLNFLTSRIGLTAMCDALTPQVDIYERFTAEHRDCNVIIADECQFFTGEQIDQLRRIVDEFDIPVLCFGIRTDFLTRLFEGSARLFEIADTISEIKAMCECGSKATVNARLNERGEVITEGEQILLGGNETYMAMCHKCYTERIMTKNEDR